MFDTDDWDLDQDFLNDIDDKAVEFYSQSDNQETEPKRRKIEICNDPIFSPDNNVDLDDRKSSSKEIVKSDKNKESRKHLILSMFNKNVLDENVSQTICESKKSCDNTLSNVHSDIQNHKDNKLSRKNLVLGILKNKNIQDKIVQKNITHVNPRKVEAKIRNNNNINVNQEFKVPSTNGIKHQILKNNCQRENSFNNDNSKSNSIKNSRKELLCNIMKPESVNNLKPKNDIIKNTLSITKDQVQPNKKMTLVRKFPGPAGLLPDDIDTIPPVSYLNSLEENEKTNEENNSSKLPEYCSQNTKNLFTEGAWQLMLDDLPQDFLKGYEIAIVKQMASTKGCNSTKVKFMAGIIERIDHSHENPPIVLRDFTDNIQGIVHRDIPLKYPGLLEPNVVVLLHDVGLLKISSTFVSNKYQILISPSSLLGIYTNKGEIERTVHMASVLENVSKEETGKEQKKKKDYSFSKPSKAPSSKTDFQFKLKHSSNIQDSSSSKKSTEDIKTNSPNTYKTVQAVNESMDFDIDLSISISPAKITNSQNQKNFTDSTLKKHANENSKQPFVEKQKESTHNDDKVRAENLLKALKRFSPNIYPKKRLPLHSKNVQMDAVLTKQVKQKVLSDSFSEQMHIDDCDGNTSQEKVESVAKEVPSSFCNKTESVQRRRVSIRSKLLQFKSPEELSPPSVESQNASNVKQNDETLIKKKMPETSSFFNDVLGNTENDSDDEMLSQLDMDTIFSNCN